MPLRLRPLVQARWRQIPAAESSMAAADHLLHARLFHDAPPDSAVSGFPAAKKPWQAGAGRQRRWLERGEDRRMPFPFRESSRAPFEQRYGLFLLEDSPGTSHRELEVR